MTMEYGDSHRNTGGPPNSHTLGVDQRDYTVDFASGDCGYLVTPFTNCTFSKGHTGPCRDILGVLTYQKPTPHVRFDRTLREVAYPDFLPFPVKQINYVRANQVQGKESTAHRHMAEYEHFVCLEGQLAFSLQRPNVGFAESVMLAPGMELTIIPTTWHSFHTSPDAQWLVLRSHKYDPAAPDKVMLVNTPRDPAVLLTRGIDTAVRPSV